MKKVIIKAYNGRGDAKTFAGEQEVQKPDTVDEAVKLYGGDKVLERFWDAHVIYVQNRIRTGAGTSDRAVLDQIRSKARQQKADGDDSLFNQLVHLGVIKE